jgi:O-acetyl-ADP-ribose deacetylase (regulator of RNase III)
LATDTKPIEKKLGKAIVRLQIGDLTALAVDGLVFYAQENLDLGAGYGRAIQTRGGAGIKGELDKIGSIKMGEAVVTTAGELEAKHVVHACGPKFHEPNTEKKLSDCMLSALRAADEKGLKTVAFPPMGTGFYGVPLEVCSSVMLNTIKAFLQGKTSLEEVLICVVDQREFDGFKGKVEQL